jgi:ABC-2 type transport system permease protein
MVMNVFSGWAPQSMLDMIADFSFLTRFASISKGILDLRDMVYFALVIVSWLLANTIVLEFRKAD